MKNWRKSKTIKFKQLRSIQREPPIRKAFARGMYRDQKAIYRRKEGTTKPKSPLYKHTLQKVDRKGGQKTEKVGRKGGQKTKESILSLIASDPFVTTNEMSKRLEINRSAISKHIKKLKEDHIIERIGPDKGGKWLIKK